MALNRIASDIRILRSKQGYGIIGCITCCFEFTVYGLRSVVSLPATYRSSSQIVMLPFQPLCDCLAKDLPLFLFIRHYFQIACTKGRRTCVQVLVRAGANKESKSFLKETPLDCLNSANADNRRVITQLLEGKIASNERKESIDDD